MAICSTVCTYQSLYGQAQEGTEDGAIAPLTVRDSDVAVPGGVLKENVAALDFDAEADGPSSARRFLCATLTNWQLPHLIDPVTAIAAELIANAISHAFPAGNPLTPTKTPSGSITLMGTDQAVICAVADPSPVPPTLTDADPLAESGRGLHIVSSLSESWGHAPTNAGGKTVWAQIPIGMP